MSLLTSPPPPAAIEISAGRVNVVALSSHGSSRTITGQSSEPLPDGAVTPALNGPNVHDAAALAAAVKAAVDRMSPRPKRAALLLPDTVAKVSLVRFDKVPPKVQDLEQLIRWQVRKAAPFRIEDAQVSWVEGAAAEGARDYLVLVARRDIVQSYERACDAAGVQAGIVDIVSTNQVNAVLATDASAASGDWMLVHTAPDYSTIIIVRNGRAIFFRSRPADGLPQDMGDLVHQTAMYYEDRLGGTAFSRVVLAGSSSFDPALVDRGRRQIEERLGVKGDLLDVRKGVTLRDRIAAGPEVLDALAPAVGVLLRDLAPAAARGREQVA
ncbi:MAG: pilus assembly protein PilM [Acidobacteriota bacterium]|nr:pilus assembly protein PilM [Acidobacteriota bacterium]